MVFVNYWCCENEKCVKKFLGEKYYNKRKWEKKCQQHVKSKSFFIDTSNPEFVLVDMNNS